MVAIVSRCPAVVALEVRYVCLRFCNFYSAIVVEKQVVKAWRSSATVLSMR